MSSDQSPSETLDVAFDTIDDGARLRFETAWRTGKPVTIEACVDGLAGPARMLTLEQLVRSEMTLAWQNGRGTTVEGYLRRFPELAEDHERVRRLVHQEAWVRHRYADSPAVDSYRGRFPELFAEPATVSALERVTASADEQAGPLGRYRIDGEIGRGGFGTVWAARDPQLGRVVALKQLHADIALREDTRRRFVEEARVAARLEHPGVVPVYELGEAAGAPFFAMKLVKGKTLADVIVEVHGVDGARTAGRRDALGEARLLEAFVAVARTMAFAHAKGVIHRDLKPQNVILGDYGETVILDWGLAKSLDEREAARRAAAAGLVSESDSGMTQAGAILGTPAYMAPEQARGEIDRLDRRSDVFSLGAMLYEVLTGRLPFPRPSAIDMMADIASSHPVEVRPRELVKRLPRALEAICLKALEKDAARRYADAGALAADLARHLAGAPVEAHRETLLERAARWARHHRGAVLALGAILIVVTVAAVVAAVLVDGERAQARQAEAVARAAEAVAERERAAAERERAAAERARDEALHHAYVASIALALRAWEDGDLAEADRQLDATPEGRRGWEYRYVRGLAHGERSEVTPLPARRLALDPSGGLVAIGGADAIVRVFDRSAGGGDPTAPVVTIQAAGTPDELVLLPGPRLVARSGVRAQTFAWSSGVAREVESGEALRIMRTEAGEPARLLYDNALAIGPPPLAMSTRLHVATPGTEDASNGAVPEVVAITPEGHLAVTIDWAQRMRATALGSGALVWDVALADLASPQLAVGAVIAVAQDRRFGGRVTRYELADGAVREPALDLERPVTALAVAPDRDVVVAGTIDGALHVIAHGVESNVIRAHRGPVRDVAWSGGDIVSAAIDGARAWDPRRAQAFVEGTGAAVAFTSDGRWLDGMGLALDRWTGELLDVERPMLGGYAEQVAVAGRSGDAVVMLFDRQLWVGSLATREGDLVWDAELFAVAANGQIVSYLDDNLRRWDADRRRELGEPIPVAPGGRALAIAPGPTGGWRVVRGEDGDQAAVSLDGDLIATSRPSGPVVIQDRAGTAVRNLAGAFEQVTALAFTADGQRLVVGDGLRLGIWDVARGLEVMSLALPERARRLTTSPDGRSIGCALVDGRVLIFNAAWPR
ncbi:MAG: protein kinase [Deltaproteobacteria bacterium]|nr:protein kinase [Deltaproteobacteria bacterium]